MKMTTCPEGVGKILYACEWSCLHGGWLQHEMNGFQVKHTVAIFKIRKKKNETHRRRMEIL